MLNLSDQMTTLGFYADISGISKDLLKGNDAKVMHLIYQLANDLHHLGAYAADHNLARFLMYQMGDGFMVHFDNVKFKANANCHGDANSMVRLTVSLAYRFLIKHNGILKIGLAEGDFFGISHSGFKFVEGNSNGNNSYRCKEGLIFLLPVSGALLAKTYHLTNLHNTNKYFEPTIFIHSDLYGVLSNEMKECLIKQQSKDGFWWIYDLKRSPGKSISDIYNQVWDEEINSEKFLTVLDEYNKVLSV